MSLDRWTGKEDEEHKHAQWNTTQPWKWNNATCSHMYGPKDYQTKYVREKNIMWYYLQVQCNKNNTDELIYNTETNSQILKSNLWLPKQKRGGGSDKLGDSD